MKLREQILKEHSRANHDEILHWIGNSQTRFDELFGLFANDSDYRVVQRAAWPLSNAVIAYPHFIKKHFAGLLNNLKKTGLHGAVKRNTIRLLAHIEIPKKFHGDIMNTCFDYVVDPNEEVAVKVFSLTVLEDLSKQYPEIIQELSTIIEDRWDQETAAFRSRGKKILQRFKRKI